MLTTLDLQHATRTLFGGDGFTVCSIDNLPEFRKTNLVYIFNTDSGNLPGTHWIAVMVKKNVGFVFDPFGHTPPTRIKHWLNARNYQWSSNLRQVQPITSALCGAYCLYFLWFAKSNYLNEDSFENIIKLLFPLQFSTSHYDSTVRNFIKLILPQLYPKL